MGTVALPVRDQIATGTAVSLLQCDWGACGPVRRFIIQGGILPLQRNECVQRMQGEWLVFIDDDMVFHRHALRDLINSWYALADPMAMVGGLCFRRSSPYQPTLYMREQPTSGLYRYLEYWEKGMVEVDATGCAFLLIPKAVFEAIAGIPMPPYEERMKMTRPPEFFRWTGTMGEDLRFCQDAKAAGARIFVDTRIEIGHVAEAVITEKEFLGAMAERPPSVEAEAAQLNAAMGLPTITSREARERLGLA